MQTVQEFNERLAEVFGHRLRLRPSLTRETTLLMEERVGRRRTLSSAIADLPNKSIWQARKRADDLTRAADGFSPVFELQVGSRSACVVCNREYHVPVMKFVELKCPRCSNSFITGFFPLGESLIDHLKMSDPTRVDQLRRVRAETSRAEWLKTSADTSFKNEVGESFRDSLIDQIPSFAFTGKTGAWK